METSSVSKGYPKQGLSLFLSNFKTEFGSAKGYDKVALVINFFLPGLGGFLFGVVEESLLAFIGYSVLWALAIYSGIQVAAGAVIINSVTLVVCYIVYIIGIVGIDFISSRNLLEIEKLRQDGTPYEHSFFFGGINKFGQSVAKYWQEVASLYKNGNQKDKVCIVCSYLLMGIPETLYKRVLQGICFLIAQIAAVLYFALGGASQLAGLFTLGGADISKLIYGVMALVILVVFIAIYVSHLKSFKKILNEEKAQKENEGLLGELDALANDKFYTISLFIPIVGALLFTVVPLVFMILTAFTNYSLKNLTGSYLNNITWAGLDSFIRLFSDASSFQDLLSVFGWTMLWAFLATFTCYFGGLFLAMLLNKKCIKGKVIYRSLFVVAMAVPQFVSLLVMKALFLDNGAINQFMISRGWISEGINFWGNEYSAKFLIIMINMWVGIPYYMLLTSGLLLNIPSDLYEAASIEGATGWQKFRYITFPEILFMTTPLLISSFVSNINNFNVIWFLNGGGQKTAIAGTAYNCDILITWLYRITIKTDYDYNLAAALGIIMFIVEAVVSLKVFTNSKAYHQEEEFR